MTAIDTGLTPQEAEDILRTAFPEMDKGVKVEIPAELAQAYQQAQEALDAWKLRLVALNVQVRRHLGSAQTATFNGVPVCSRRMYHRESYTMPATDVDALYRAKQG